MESQRPGDRWINIAPRAARRRARGPAQRTNPGKQVTAQNRLVQPLGRPDPQRGKLQGTWGRHLVARDSLGRSQDARRAALLSLVTSGRNSLFLAPQSLFVAGQCFTVAFEPVAQAALVQVSDRHRAIRRNGPIIAVDRFIEPLEAL